MAKGSEINKSFTNKIDFNIEIQYYYKKYMHFVTKHFVFYHIIKKEFTKQPENYEYFYLSGSSSKSIIFWAHLIDNLC